MKHSVLMSQESQNEIALLQNDAVLIEMYQSVPSHIDINEIPFGVVNSQYEKFGGTHQPNRIGSLKDALLKMRKVS